MRITRPNWKEPILREDQVLAVQAVKLATLYRGRNAWHGVWAQHYIKNTDLFLDAKSAQIGAELLRERGNVFYVREIPGLAFKGKLHNLIFTDPNAEICFERFKEFSKEVISTPFGDFAEGIYPGCTFEDAMNSMSDTGRHWETGTKRDRLLLVGVTESSLDLPLADNSFNAFISSPRGSDYFLDWIPTVNKYSSNRILDLVDSWSREFGMLDEYVAEENLSKAIWIQRLKSQNDEIERQLSEAYENLRNAKKRASKLSDAIYGCQN